MRHNNLPGSDGLTGSFPSAYLNLKCVLAYVSSEREQSIPIKQLDLIIQILQLIKTENIVYGNTYFQKIKNWQDDPIDAVNDNQNLSRKPGRTITFSANDVVEIKNMFNKISKINWNNLDTRFLRLALSKYDIAIHENDLPNKILDYSIALESLFLKKSETEGVTSIISNRIAWMLGDNVDERERIHVNFRGIYALRSAIAHGGDIDEWVKEKGKGKTRSEWIELAENICRKSITRLLLMYIKKQMQKDNLLDEIRLMLFSGKFYKDLKF